jgi:hypothetical protein
VSRFSLISARLSLGALALLAVSSGAARAQTPSPADLAARRSLCAQSVSLSGLEGDMDKQINEAVEETYDRLIAVSPPGDAAVTAYRDALSGALLAAKAPIIGKLVEACALTFTKLELEDINRFYVSSSGKAWLEKGRVIMLPVLEKAVYDVAPQVAADVERRFCAKVDCAPAKASPPSPRKDRTL